MYSNNLKCHIYCVIDMPVYFWWCIGHSVSGAIVSIKIHLCYYHSSETLIIEIKPAVCLIWPVIDLKNSMLNKTASFNVWVRYFALNLKGALWNSSQNILPIGWKVDISLTGENLWALRLISFFETCTPWITIVYISAPLSFFTDILCDSLYIMIQYNVLLHTAQQLRM